MYEIELVFVLLAVSGALQLLARRLTVPYPSLLVIGGLALAFIPGLPRIDRDPEVIFFVFIPPLLYWTAVTTSLRELRDLFGSVARLSTGLVLLTMVVVAAVIHALSPEFSWGSALLLGAIVAPPDPVAASAIIRPLGISREISTVLEGEGLFNDATALVAYRVALTAVLLGTFSPTHAAINLIVAGAGGIAIGLAAGWLIVLARRHIGQFPIVENTLSLLSPFIAYVPADAVGTSGVLAVVALGLFLGRQRTEITSPATRIQSEAMWTVLTFMLESIIFILIGLELPRVVAALSTHSLTTLLGYAALTTVVCIAIRFLWVAVAVALLRRSRRRRHKEVSPSWSEGALVAWAGMRGADSLVIALAIPMVTSAGRPFPARDLILFITFGVIFATLVVQGLTLAPAIKLLRLPSDPFDTTHEAVARAAEARAALKRLGQLSVTERISPHIISVLRNRYAARLKRWSARRAGSSANPTETQTAVEEKWDTHADEYAHVREELLRAEQGALTELRTHERVSDYVLTRLQRELDLEMMLLDSSQAEGDELNSASPFEVDDLG